MQTWSLNSHPDALVAFEDNLPQNTRGEGDDYVVFKF